MKVESAVIEINPEELASLWTGRAQTLRDSVAQAVPPAGVEAGPATTLALGAYADVCSQAQRDALIRLDQLIDQVTKAAGNHATTETTTKESFQ